MKQYRIVLCVARSNPAIIREIEIMAHKTIKDYLNLTGIVFGIDCEQMEMYSDNEKKCKLDQVMEDVIEEEPSGYIILSDGKEKRKTQELTIFYTLVEEYDAETSTPKIIDATGMQLPMGQYNIGTINQIQDVLFQREHVEIENGEIFSKTDLLFSEKKVQNAIYKYFEPELSTREINKKIGIPMQYLMQNLKIQQLKEIENNYHVINYYSSRKDDRIQAIKHKFDQNYFEKMFDMMSVEEYKRFKEIVLDDNLLEIPKEAEKELSSFVKRGLLVEVPKKGYYIAQEILEYYEAWYDTEKEKMFIPYKFLRTALNASIKMYGFVSLERFETVAKVYAADELDEQLIKQFFSVVLTSAGSYGCKVLDNNILFDEYMGKKDAQKIWSVMLQGKDDFYIPQKEEIVKYDNGIYFYNEKNDKRIKEIIKQCLHGYYYDTTEENRIYLRIFHEMQKGISEENAYELLKKSLYHLEWHRNKEQIYKEIRQIIHIEIKTIPLIVYGGYSRKNVPSKIEDYVKKVQQNTSGRKK